MPTLREVLLGQPLPGWFDDVEGYARHQFEVGWTLRQQLAPRQPGSSPGFSTHPDAGKGWEQLPAEVRDFVHWISQWQVQMFRAFGKEPLNALRTAGQHGEIPEPLLKLVRTAHHHTWLAARDSYVALGLGNVRPHASHKAESNMSEDELAKQAEQNGAQVRAYAVTLSAMPDEHFAALEAAAK